MNIAEQCAAGARQFASIISRASDPDEPVPVGKLLGEFVSMDDPAFWPLFASVCAMLAALRMLEQSNPGTTEDEYLMALLSGMIAGIPR